MRVHSLGQEDPLEESMATHSSILAWRIPWTEELGKLGSIGWQRVGHDWVTWHSTVQVQFSCSVMSDSLRPHALQHSRLPCPSPSPRVYSNSCPLSLWRIQSFHPLSLPSPPALNLSQQQCLFQWISSSNQVAKVLELQLQHQSFQWIFRIDFL